MLQALARAHPRRLFYGWIIVLVGFLNQALLTGFGSQGMGTYLVPLETEFGSNKSQLAGGRSLQIVEGGLIDPLQGFLVDRFGPRRMMALGMFIFGGGLILLGQVHALWSYYLILLLTAVGSGMGGYLAITSTLNNWFRRNRTIAMALSTAGLGAGGIILVPLLVWAQDAYGWRAATTVAGLTAWAIGIPITLLMRRSPEPYGLRPDGDLADGSKGGRDPHPSLPPSRGKGRGVPDPARAKEQNASAFRSDFTWTEAVHTSSFWFIAMGHAFAVMVFTAVSVHQFAHMEQGIGLARSSAAAVVTVFSATSICGLVIGGLLGDRIDKRILLATGVAGSAVALLLFALANSLAMALVFGVLFGISWGIRSGPMMHSLRGQYFGRANFGKIAGTSSLIVTPSAIFGPMLAALFADLRGSYDLAFFILAGVSLVGSVMFILARPPRLPPRLR